MDTDPFFGIGVTKDCFHDGGIHPVSSATLKIDNNNRAIKCTLNLIYFADMPNWPCPLSMGPATFLICLFPSVIAYINCLPIVPLRKVFCTAI